MKRHKPELIDWTFDETQAFLDRAAQAGLGAEDRKSLEAVFATLLWLMAQLETMGTTIAILRRAFSINMKKTEKTSEVLRRVGEEQSGEDESAGTESAGTEDAGTEDAGTEDAPSVEKGEEKKKPKGHGRNGAEDYPGAEKIQVPHESLKAGDPCPEEECAGKLYRKNPVQLIRLRGNAPISATLWELDRLRCNICGKTFTATAPAGVGEDKHDESVASIIALMKYGSGLPFNRLAGLQRNFGIPLPVSTQWDIINAEHKKIEPVYDELIWCCAQGEIIHNDDTPMKILTLLKENERLMAHSPASRTGIFTSGFVAHWGTHRIVLFFTGRRHAGENLEHIMGKREEGLEAPIQMCDGSSSNNPKDSKTILANCMGHGRRKFVEITASFPRECVHVLELLRIVYRNDAFTREQEMSKQERLRYHQEHSVKPISELRRWMREQLREKKVEPNSSLGKAFTYMLKRWRALTLFLRKPGAPLDNNICERALKKAILHRKNSLFYKTENGAHVGDIFMSLIYTAELAGENPFHYLVELLKHVEDVGNAPGEWLPWNYRKTLAALGEADDG